MTIERFGEDLLEYLMLSGRFIETMDRRPEAAIQLMRLGLELGGRRGKERFGKFLRKEVHLDSIAAIIDKIQDSALAMIRLYGIAMSTHVSFLK